MPSDRSAYSRGTYRKVRQHKKGQFLSPSQWLFAVQKIRDAGNDQVAVTERGSTFGYQDLIVDYRGIPEMRKFATTILDITHSLQQPNQAAGVTGGRPDLIETIARAGIAVEPMAYSLKPIRILLRQKRRSQHA